MRKQLRTLAIFVAATLLVASCGDNDNGHDDNDNTDTRTPTPVVTSTPGPTAPGETATAVVPTETPTPEETETPPPGPTSTAGGPTPVVTETPIPDATATLTPTPQPTATATAAFCGNGIKEDGEQCDSGTVFGSNADCSEQCACCLCRPDSVHASVPMTKCSTCHPSIAPSLTFPPGAAETFPGLCE